MQSTRVLDSLVSPTKEAMPPEIGSSESLKPVPGLGVLMLVVLMEGASDAITQVKNMGIERDSNTTLSAVLACP